MGRLRTRVSLLVAGLALSACAGNDPQSTEPSPEGSPEANTVANHRNVPISTSS